MLLLVFAVAQTSQSSALLLLIDGCDALEADADVDGVLFRVV